ncbi:MAG: rhodanese-like domain-containing protein [Gammaproteobacteria bacterium]
MQQSTRSLLFALAAVTAVASQPVAAYDADLAKRIHTDVTGKMDREFFAGWTHIDGKDVLSMLAAGEAFTLVDVRTPEERAVLAFELPNAWAIPLNTLFQPANLDRLAGLPGNQKILLVCKGGTRSAMASAYLGLLGFKNVSFVHGGSDAIAAALSPRSVK